VRITTLAEYGVICALHLARRIPEGPITGREIAAQERLPVDYVEQILTRLTRAGIVRSTRGAHGGYALARAPGDISIRDVIEASETTTFDLHCVSHPVDEEKDRRRARRRPSRGSPVRGERGAGTRRARGA
jgi:Rrf2 family protein